MARNPYAWVADAPVERGQMNLAAHREVALFLAMSANRDGEYFEHETVGRVKFFRHMQRMFPHDAPAARVEAWFIVATTSVWIALTYAEREYYYQLAEE
jgi:hypothetical protein